MNEREPQAIGVDDRLAIDVYPPNEYGASCAPAPLPPRPDVATINRLRAERFGVTGLDDGLADETAAVAEDYTRDLMLADPTRGEAASRAVARATRPRDLYEDLGSPDPARQPSRSRALGQYVTIQARRARRRRGLEP